MSKGKLTPEQVNEAVETLGKWFPEEARKLVKYREAIVDYVVRGAEPPSDHPLAIMKHETQSASSQTPEGYLGLTPCQEACGVVFFDVVMFVFGLIGLHVSNEERISRAIIRELGGETLRGFAREIQEFSEADSAMNKAKVLYTLMGQIKRASGFNAFFKVIKDDLTWWDWIKTCVIAVAQITAWFATDGIAFIAEAALSIMSAEQLIEDAVKAVKACN